MTEHDHILIERYLDKEMGPEERLQFELRLAQEQSLRSALNTMQSTQHFLQYEALKKEKSAISAAGASYHKEQLLKRVLLVGGLLLVVSLTLFYFMKQNKHSDFSKNSRDTTLVKEKPSTLSKSEETSIIPTELRKKNQGAAITDPKIEADLKDTSYTTGYAKPNISELQKKEIQKEKADLEPSVLCNYLIDLVTEEMATCPEKSNGSIRIKNVSGGNPPYLYRINEGMFSDLDHFNFLKAGSYKVHVSDRYNCGSEVIIQVPEKDCPKEVSGIISYSQNTEWKFPVDIEEGNFTVVNGAGEIVWKSTIHAGQPASWSGLDERQQNLPAGAYYYKLFEGDVIKALGSITIVQ